MEEKYTGSEHFVLPQYDDSFDFDFDLQISAVEYVFFGIYLLFTVPFELLFKIIAPFPQQPKERKNPLEKANEGAEFFQPELCKGPCCLWPGTSQD